MFADVDVFLPLWRFDQVTPLPEVFISRTRVARWWGSAPTLECRWWSSAPAWGSCPWPAPDRRCPHDWRGRPWSAPALVQSWSDRPDWWRHRGDHRVQPADRPAVLLGGPDGRPLLQKTPPVLPILPLLPARCKDRHSLRRLPLLLPAGLRRDAPRRPAQGAEQAGWAPPAPPAAAAPVPRRPAADWCGWLPVRWCVCPPRELRLVREDRASRRRRWSSGRGCRHSSGWRRTRRRRSWPVTSPASAAALRGSPAPSTSTEGRWYGVRYRQ